MSTPKSVDGRVRGLRLRRLAALVLAGAFAVMLASGAVLFFGPHGAAGRGAAGAFLAVTRLEWRAIHGAMAGLFLAAGLLHAWLNRRALLGYLERRAGARPKPSLELLLAVALLAAFVLAAWAGWIPLGLQEGAGAGPGPGAGRGRFAP